MADQLQEKKMNKIVWVAAYNPSDPIKDLYDRLFIVADVAKPAYTFKHMVDKALIDIQLTSLYPTSILEWNATDERNHTWPDFKAHFTEAYDLQNRLSAGRAGTMGYHSAHNAAVVYDNI